MSVQTIGPRALHDKRAAGERVELIDVRTPVEYRAVHAEGSTSVPLDRLEPSEFKDAGPVYVICKSGARGQKACEKFAKAGLHNAVNVEGGTEAWEAAGLPVKRGKKAISLERQVRIAAGLLILTGAALGLLVHEGFYGLSAFIGAGLLFAGLTDTCGMGMLLAKMPWNQVNLPEVGTGPAVEAGVACSLPQRD